MKVLCVNKKSRVGLSAKNGKPKEFIKLNMNDIKEAYFSVPPISRYYITAVFMLSFSMTYSNLSPYSLLLNFEKVFYQFQVFINQINTLTQTLSRRPGD
jgi:hypothetical protein